MKDYDHKKFKTYHAMKKVILLTASLMFVIYAYASNSIAELKESHAIPQIELDNILNKVLDVDENLFFSQFQKQNKIIIMDKNFNKIREAYLDKNDHLNNQSMFQPFIYRSQFITKVHNVSYYILEKK